MTHIRHDQIASIGQIKANTFLLQQVLKNLNPRIESNRVKGIDYQRQLNLAKRHRDSIESKANKNRTSILSIPNLSNIRGELDRAKLHRDSIESKVQKHSHAGDNILDQIRSGIIGGGISGIAVAGVIAYFFLRRT